MGVKCVAHYRKFPMINIGWVTGVHTDTHRFNPTHDTTDKTETSLTTKQKTKIDLQMCRKWKLTPKSVAPASDTV